jgi:periplasmic divalent cation tolerance protein
MACALPPDDTVLLCYCSCPDAASARAIAVALVEARLAACVNCLPDASSTYRWQGAVTTDDEHLLLIKTTAARFEAMRERLLALHPYDLPELVGVPVVRGHDAYLDWVRAQTTEQGDTGRRART